MQSIDNFLFVDNIPVNSSRGVEHRIKRCYVVCCINMTQMKDNYVTILYFQARIAFLQGERKGQENLKKDLVRRIKMLEYALKQERYLISCFSTEKFT